MQALGLIFICFFAFIVASIVAVTIRLGNVEAETVFSCLIVGSMHLILGMAFFVIFARLHIDRTALILVVALGLTVTTVLILASKLLLGARRRASNTRIKAEIAREIAALRREVAYIDRLQGNP